MLVDKAGAHQARVARPEGQARKAVAGGAGIGAEKVEGALLARRPGAHHRNVCVEDLRGREGRGGQSVRLT